jgi:hypothetical protein
MEGLRVRDSHWGLSLTYALKCWLFFRLLEALHS